MRMYADQNEVACPNCGAEITVTVRTAITDTRWRYGKLADALLRVLTRGGKWNQTQLGAAAKVTADDMKRHGAEALAKLTTQGNVSCEDGPRGSKRWFALPFHERTDDLPAEGAVTL